MNNLKTSVILLTLAASLATAQTSEIQPYWIFLQHRVPPGISLSAPDAAKSLGISDRALRRRAKSLPHDRLFDEFDLPVSEAAVAQIRQSGVTIRFVSRWLNAVSVEATSQQIQSLTAMPIVRKAEPVARMSRPRVSPVQAAPVRSLHKNSASAVLDYGQSAGQLSNIKIADLQSLGVFGNGVVVGMLDDGFNNYRTHPALRNIRVLETYDFIHNIVDVSRQPWEESDQGHHGAGTLSVLGGFRNGQLIGAAFGASFILAKTEMDSSGNRDFHSEEDTYVAALEWMERLGVDITSSSLAYKDFSPPPTYSTSDLNGRTTKVAQAAIIAVRKGVLPVTAMGNEGYLLYNGVQYLHADSTLWSPADADSILSVGATGPDSILTDFSSCGPTADGRIKPEIVAQGRSVLWADASTDTSYGFADGTSLSTPLAAGAAALVLSAHPELTAMQIRNALIGTAVHINDGTPQSAGYPNNYYGYGMVDALDAALSCGPVFSNRPLVMRTDSSYNIYMWIRQSTNVPLDSVVLHFKRASEIVFQEAELFPIGTGNAYVVSVPLSSIDSTTTGYITARDQSGTLRQAPYAAPADVFSLAPASDSITAIFPPPPPPGNLPTAYKLYDNYPNPFNGGTTIKFDLPATTDVDLAIFNILGQRIKTILRGRFSPSQIARIWDGSDEFGYHVATGVYIARLKTPEVLLSKKMLYIK